MCSPVTTPGSASGLVAGRYIMRIQVEKQEEGGKSMFRKLFVILALCSVITLLLVACDTVSSATSTAGNTVHMNGAQFVQASITIKKGERLTLIDDALTPHIIANGTWENGTAHSAREPGAPQVKDVQINGNSSQTIGPFTTAGTFKLYCTIHSGMNLTVVVQ
jgi:plastocyanin